MGTGIHNKWGGRLRWPRGSNAPSHIIQQNQDRLWLLVNAQLILLFYHLLKTRSMDRVPESIGRSWA
jgi:hypothetical protein